MASTNKQLAQDNPGNTSTQTFYTVPALTTTVGITIRVTNVTATMATFRIYHPPSGTSWAVGNAVAYDVEVQAGESRQVSIPVATTAQNIGIEQGTLSACTFTAYGTEKT